MPEKRASTKPGLPKPSPSEKGEQKSCMLLEVEKRMRLVRREGGGGERRGGEVKGEKQQSNAVKEMTGQPHIVCLSFV